MQEHRRYHKPGEFGYGLKFLPMYDKSLDDAVKEWFDGWELWQQGRHKYQIEFPKNTASYADYAGFCGRSPDPEYYHPAWKPEEITCYQMYETVSEGTPTSPVFETLKGLETWMVKEAGYSPAAAAEFCKEGAGWAPSFVFTPKTGMVDGIEALGMMPDENNLS